MPEGFDGIKPETGFTTFGALYNLLRVNLNALDSAHSGTSFPTAPVGGRLCWNTNYSPRKLFIYNDLDLSWDEVAIDSSGIGLEVTVSRGSHTSLDNRLDIALNEDGTLRAGKTLNPSEWYTWSGETAPFNRFIYQDTTTFKFSGEDATPIFRPNRRVKVNRVAGTYYTSIVSSACVGRTTTIITRDAVISSDLENVSHSIVNPVKASAGDGAVS